MNKTIEKQTEFEIVDPCGTIKVRKFERFCFIGHVEKGLCNVREVFISERAFGRTGSREIAYCGSQDDAQMIVDALNKYYKE
jgi:hypothetical protein